MVQVGVAAPKFDCRAVVGGVLRRLRWQQLHENKTLLLLFESHLSTAEEVAELPALDRVSRRLRLMALTFSGRRRSNKDLRRNHKDLGRMERESQCH